MSDNGTEHVNSTDSDSGTDAEYDFVFTTEGKLRHENDYLQTRVDHLESFKKNFFSSNAKLIEAQKKLAQYEQQIELDKIKQRITGLPDTLDNMAVFESELNEDILNFFQESYSTEHYRDIISCIFQSVDGLGLDISVQVKTSTENLTLSIDKAATDENIQLIDYHRNQGELIENDDYIIINLTNLSLLVKNISPDNKERSSQIKSFLNIIAVGANMRLDSFHKDYAFEMLQKNIYQIFKKTRASFESMQNNVDDQIIQLSELYLNFEKKLIDSLKKMHVAGDTIKLITRLSYETKSELNLLLTSSLTIDEDFLASIIKLEKAYSGIAQKNTNI